MSRIQLDLNNTDFQSQWFALEKSEALALLATLQKIQQMEWQELYRHKGLHWEAILSKTTPSGTRIYSLRVTREMRALARRDGNFLRMLSLHPDHDSAYR